MKKQNLEKELSPIFDNESIKIGTFKANRSIDTLDLIKGNIKFGNVRFDEVLRVFPLLPKSYLNE